MKYEFNTNENQTCEFGISECLELGIHKLQLQGYGIHSAEVWIQGRLRFLYMGWEKYSLDAPDWRQDLCFVRVLWNKGQGITLFMMVLSVERGQV